MSESSRSHVTVTLGRTGRVVKRAGGFSEEGFLNGMSVAGSKRSVKDRMGGSSDDRDQQHKRLRGESFGTGSLNDMCLGKGDLRFKLMQKNMVRQSQNSDSHGDLRDKLLSKTSQSSVNSKIMHPPECTVSTRHPLLVQRDSRMTRLPMLEPHNNTSILGRIPSSRNPGDLSAVEPSRTYSSWTFENLRQRSPERLYRSSSHRGLSPERNREDLQRRSMRAYDDGRSSSSMRTSPTKAVSSTPYMTKSSLPAVPMKSVVPLSPHYPQASGIVRKVPSMGDEHPSVESFLQSLGLDKYAIYFKAEEIDMNALRQLGDNDLKELGIPMGPRKKIVQAVMSRSRRLP